MPVFPSTRRVAPFVVFAAAVVLPVSGWSAAAPVVQSPASKSAPAPLEAEVRCVDDSVIKLKVLDETLDLETKYGTLKIAVADVRRIDFATRTPAEVAERVNLLISNLNHPDFALRERASAELRGYRERAYLPLLKAIKHQDAEISRRADESVRFLQQKLSAVSLETRDSDVVFTDDSKVAGKLKAATLRVETFQFGEQSLRLADVRTLRSAHGVAAEELANAPVAPANMMAFQNQAGKELVYTVTGPVSNGQGPGVWGTDVYTLDSNIGAAAVHAGLVQPGQAAVVRVRVVASPGQFVGSLRNGIGSTPYGAYPAGGFEFVKK